MIPRGIRCPECGGTQKTYRTAHKPGKTTRYHRCNKCRNTFISEQRVKISATNSTPQN